MTAFLALLLLFASPVGALVSMGIGAVDLTPVDSHGPLQAPVLVAGQHVYTVPPGFDPPLVGKAGMAKLEKAMSERHFPSYVVFVKELPQPGLPAEERASNAIDGLAADWTGVPGFDPAVSQIFLLAYEPRQYRFLAGAKFKAELGFERAAHKPFTAHFERAVQGTPKDPVGGILKTMVAVDEHLFDRTDPARIAAREEAARVLAEQRRLDSARGHLDEEIALLSGLLEEKEYLPSDVSGYQTLLKDALALRGTQKDNPDALSRLALSMHPSAMVLMGSVGAAKAAARERLFALVMWWLFALALLVGAFVALLLRWKRYSNAKATLRVDIESTQKKLKAAFGRYYDLYGDRDSVLALDSLVGESKALYDRVTQTLDSIALALNAVGVHIGKMEELGATGGFLFPGRIEAAIKGLHSSFTFDTEVVNRAELFGPPTKTIEVETIALFVGLDKRFKEALDDWERLKVMADARMHSAAEHFPQTTLDALLVRADAARIPSRWLSDHPLFGDDTADASLWKSAEDLRFSDPVAFMAKIEEWRGREMAVSTHLVRLETALKSVKEGGPIKLPEVVGIVLDPDDDPAITYDNAMREEDKLLGRIAGASTVEEVEEKAAQVVQLRQQCREQIGAVEHAQARWAEVMREATAAFTAAESVKGEAEVRTSAASKVHSASKAQSYLEDGCKYLEAGRKAIGRAFVHFSGQRTLAAIREAEVAAGAYEKARDAFVQTVKHVDALDKQKADYERKVAEAESRRSAFTKKIHGYGYNYPLDPYPVGGSGMGALDYAALLLLYNAHEKGWIQEEHRARRDYEAAEAARREVEEQERRREERRRADAYAVAAAASRRRSSSYDDSDSGGGWGGGGSSSSGGGWGGGGSSSSGGGW